MVFWPVDRSNPGHEATVTRAGRGAEGNVPELKKTLDGIVFLGVDARRPVSRGPPTMATTDSAVIRAPAKPTAGPRRVRIPMVRLLRPPEHIAPLHLGLRDSSRPEAGERNSADPRIDGEQRNRRVRPSEETPSPHFHGQHTADRCHGRDGAPRKDNGTSTDRFGTHGVTFANVGRDAGVTGHGRPRSRPFTSRWGLALWNSWGLGRNRVSHKSMSTLAPWSPADLVGSCRKPRSSRTPP